MVWLFLTLTVGSHEKNKNIAANTFLRIVFIITHYSFTKLLIEKKLLLLKTQISIYQWNHLFHFFSVFDILNSKFFNEFSFFEANAYFEINTGDNDCTKCHDG